MQLDQKQRKEADAKAAAERRARSDPSDAAVGPGYLSPSRKLDLDDMSIDLSAQLAAPPKPLLPPQPVGVEMLPLQKSGRKYVDPPSKGEKRRYDRSRGFAVRGPAAASVATRDPDAEVAEARAAEIAQYEQMRREYSLWTTGTTAVLFAMCYALYTKVCAHLCTACGAALGSKFVVCKRTKCTHVQCMRVRLAPSSSL